MPWAKVTVAAGFEGAWIDDVGRIFVPSAWRLLDFCNYGTAMTLRKRLILFFITLIGLLGLAQWWLLSTLTEQLEEGRRQDAIQIGQALFEQIGEIEPGLLPPGLLGGGEFIMEGRVSSSWQVMPEGFEPPSDWMVSADLPMITVLSSEHFGPDGNPHRFDFEIPHLEDPIDHRMQEFRSGLMLGTALILLLALLVLSIGAHKLGVPLHQLATTARKVGQGGFGETLPVRGGAEVEEVIQSFNSMSTQLADLQQEADRLKEQAHLNEVGEMARGLAHAMRNPLHVIGLSVQRLNEAGIDENRRHDLAQSMAAQVKRMDRAMRNFLALSSAGSGHMEQVSLLDTCRDVALELMQSGDPVPNIKINAEPGLPTLTGVAAEVRALVHVLMTNAVEASAESNPANRGGDGDGDGVEGAAQVEVQIRTTDTPAQLQVEVLDRGCGIASELKKKLFTPHFTTKEHGAGLGLYLARRIAVSRYGGDLDLANREGGGCRAWLSLKPLQEGDND
jgi:signal transduction histidine kinase